MEPSGSTQSDAPMSNTQLLFCFLESLETPLTLFTLVSPSKQRPSAAAPVENKEK